MSVETDPSPSKHRGIAAAHGPKTTVLNFRRIYSAKMQERPRLFCLAHICRQRPWLVAA
jgi:hypothetical protein